MKTMRSFLPHLTVVGLSTVFATLPAFSRTTFDAGKAFHNAGANANAFGPWSLWHANADLSTVQAFGMYPANSGAFSGISGQSSGASPWIRVNTGDTTQTGDGEGIAPNELYLHPASPDGSLPTCHLIRFTVPEAGWYSAVICAHDESRQGSSNYDSGVKVTVRAGGNALVTQIVSLENYADNKPTHRFDFQMPVRQMAVGETIEVVVDPILYHNNDATGLRFTVTKEDEGAFYDAGLAMTEDLGSSPRNPFGTIAHGTWYYAIAKTDTLPSGTAFADWAPANLSRRLSLLTTVCARAAAGNSRGYANAANGASPFFVVNTTASGISGTGSGDMPFAPGELQTHPTASSSKEWAAIRFRPPVSGLYSASVVVRDICRDTNTAADGVKVFLCVADTVVSDSVISSEQFSSTTHLSFPARLVAQNEPIDIVVSPRSNQASDATAISAIFRREADVHDAGPSMAALGRAGALSALPFADATPGASWNLGYTRNATTAAFSPMPFAFAKNNGALGWVGFSREASGTLPRIMVSTNGIASTDSGYATGGDKLAAAPNEIWLHPQEPYRDYTSPALLATAEEDGVFRVRAYGRDLSPGSSDKNGVTISVVADGLVLDSVTVSAEEGSTIRSEGPVDADRLWLRAGESARLVVHPGTTYQNDGTGLGVCLAEDGTTTGVVNIDIGAANSGRRSSFEGRGREGFGDWTMWNALHVGESATAETAECREADGDTCRNIIATLSHSGSMTLSSGSTGCAMLDTGVASSGSSDEYDFTVTGLTPGVPYTLYAYSANGGVFTVGGETKSPDLIWLVADTATAVRFATLADANGAVSGTFAAPDSSGATFGGLTIVGEFPDFVPAATVVYLR